MIPMWLFRVMEIPKLSSPGERWAMQRGSDVKHRAISRESYLLVLKAFLLLNQSQVVSKQGWGFTRGHKSFPFACRRKNGRNTWHSRRDIISIKTEMEWESFGTQTVAGGDHKVTEDPGKEGVSQGQGFGPDHRSTLKSICLPSHGRKGGGT